MPKYNIYRIEKSKEQSLIEKFELVGLIKTAEKEIDGFYLRFFFSNVPDEVEIKWIDLYF